MQICQLDKNHNGRHRERGIKPWQHGIDRRYWWTYSIAREREQGRT